MSTNPFDRNKTKEARLGQLITEPGEQNQRDAVHIAVVPIVADSHLSPGQRIGVTPDGKRSIAFSTEPVGIVDPFLVSGVDPGRTFWLFLFQGSVTTLRHEWTHPSFPDAHSTPAGKDFTVRDAAELWLREYAVKLKPYDTPEEAFTKMVQELKDNKLHGYGTDLHSRGEVENEGDLRMHAEAYLGKTLNFEDFSFSCSC